MEQMQHGTHNPTKPNRHAVLWAIIGLALLTSLALAVVGHLVWHSRSVPHPAPRIMHSVSHRGYNTEAPENTIPAYVLAKKMGFDYVECDVAFTADGVAVLLHDETIDRTSNGSGSIAELTYAQVSQYDFGSWKSSDYAGTKIPTFAEFIRICKELQLHPYIELKHTSAYMQEQINSIVAMVKAVGMQGNVTYLSFDAAYLGYVKNADPAARLGYVVWTIDAAALAALNNLRTDKNDVFIASNYLRLTDNMVDLCMDADLPLEVWCPNDAGWIENMNPYITGVISDSLNAEKILLEKHMAP